MYEAKRPFLRPFIIVLVLASFVLAACSGGISNVSWPGLTADDTTVYVAYGSEVLAFDVETQTETWSYPPEPNAALAFYAAPSVQDGRIILGDYGQSGGFLSPQPIITIYGLEETESGSLNELWKDGQLAADKIVAPPLQVDDVVYVGTANNIMLAMSAVSGVELWRFEASHGLWAQPTHQDGTLYVASLDRHLYALDAETGSLIWDTELTGALSGKPVIGNDLIYVTGFDNNIHALDISSGSIVWTTEVVDWVWSAPALDNGTIFFADSQGYVYAIAAETGDPIWQSQTSGTVQTSPLVHEELVYIASSDAEAETGLLTAYAIEDGEEIWSKTVPAPLNTTPVIADDAVVVTLQSEAALLIGFNLQTGSQKWTFTPEPAE
ncbi:MAG: PQQ-binding-like beta-propeller repeat protein [Chloroflexi bacterium]|nr:PQQ-binding-like beta-propeller repeat protein [Chloroflexota bacterium]